MDLKELKDIIAATVKENVEPIVTEKSAADKDELMAKMADEIKKAVDGVESRIKVGQEEIDKDPKGGFKTLSQFAVSVAKANKTGKLTPELEKWQAKAAGTPSHNITDNESGAYLIPDEWRSEIFKPITQDDMVIGRTRQVMLERNTISMPYVNGFDESSGKVYGAVQGSWVSEEEAGTATAMKFGTLQLSLKKLMLAAYVTNEMIEDSPASMEVILRDSFRDALTFEMNDKLIRGTGAGQPQGILNAAAKIEVAKETGQVADTILFENVVKMYSRLYNKAGNAVWMINDDAFPQIATMSMPIGTGGVPVFMPANGAAGRPLDSLMGIPIIWNKHCSTVGDAGDVVLVDWSQYYLGMKAGANADGRYEVSSHLKFLEDQQTFKLVFRCDGQSSWKSPITPPQSANTKSPIITLAARA